MILDISKLEKSLKIALNQEFVRVDEVKRTLQRLEKLPIVTENSGQPVIATVATDGGENKLFLDPIRMQIIRVVDSNGTKYFEDFIPLSLDADLIFKNFVKSNELLQWFKQTLCLEWEDILPNTPYQKASWLGMLRELLEWCVILKLMHSDLKPQLVVRDGLLRSVAIPMKVFDTLQKAFEKTSREKGHMLVGVAKRSNVLSYLSLAISLNDSLPSNEKCYVRISKEFENEASPPNYRWASSRSMGDLFLARLSENASSIFPIEIPSW
ncbi:hypothetical protein KKB99_01125, partial [bacterium]|nr:hypothetical protein [bacterium]MBU1024588.1 hypothetical protein [bacterium]